MVDSRWIKPRENAFDDPTDLAAAYWAGFIAADGWIDVRPNRKQPRLGVALMPGDTTHLCKLRSFLEMERRPIHTQKSKHTLLVTSSVMCADLTRVWHITPRKAHTYHPPDYARESMLAFYRGLFDGDGSIAGRTHPALRRIRFPRAQIVIAGSTHTTTYLQAFFKVGKVNPKQRAWYVSDYRSVKRILELVYATSTPETRLTRKYEKWRAIKAQELTPKTGN